MSNEFSMELVQQLVESEEQFPVNFSECWQWLGYSRKDKALETLKSYFILDVDFALHEKGKWTQAGRSSDLYYLTVDCFKQLAMLSRTEQGKKVRLYFLECEKVAKQVTSISPDLTQALLKMQEQLNSLVVSQVRLNQLEAQNEELQTASLAHPGCKEVLDKNAECNYPNDLVLTVKQYLTFKGLDSATFTNTLSKRAAQYYRLAKQSDPLTNRRNQVVYKGSDILYLDEALKSILDLD